MTLTRPCADWLIPDDLEAIVSKDEVWESDRWSPIALSVLGATIYHGRLIPLSWQIQFSPYGPEFEEANHRFAAATGGKPDSYRWSELVVNAMTTNAPKFVPEIHTEDTELATCVIWVESESACKALLKTVWEMIYR
ncbi:hypothetical protein J8I29_23185 [Labrys sp. LIt4]|uniref:hypothetical protein n=1 Tax=Labrys sp. LIt4 TaxID=2821355 RepID=UPI001ADFE366|nr:hypothetical protein [Labrys sp. LIt4]MBP0582249.1 hypothetical protein [Labrys sp. LIt4]